MKKSIELMKAHPIVSFFALVLVLMYILLFPLVYLYLIGYADQPLL